MRLDDGVTPAPNRVRLELPLVRSGGRTRVRITGEEQVRRDSALVAPEIELTERIQRRMRGLLAVCDLQAKHPDYGYCTRDAAHSHNHQHACASHIQASSTAPSASAE